MDVGIIGTGYVGLVSGTCFAELGHRVHCVDVDTNKIDTLRRGESPIYEPGLTEMLKRQLEHKNLSFSSQFEDIAKAGVVFLAVGTPSGDQGEADLTYLEAACKEIGRHLGEGAVVVIKSTVPVGTHKKVQNWIGEHAKRPFFVANNPEFLKEGHAIDDFMRPDRVVVGCNSPMVEKVMDELYAPLVRQGNPIFFMDNTSAEMTKYAANCFLATKISFINEMAQLCDALGADINHVRRGISSDKRIGGHFLYPGLGYGGSCFPKDVLALIHTAKERDLKLPVTESADRVNKDQRRWFMDKMRKKLEGPGGGGKIALWGGAFKANTDDIRESPAKDLTRWFVAEGFEVSLYDPVALNNFKAWAIGENLDDKITFYDNKYDCLNGAKALVVVTDWPEFKGADFNEIKARLEGVHLFDGRNLFEPEKVREAGLQYTGVGRGGQDQ